MTVEVEYWQDVCTNCLSHYHICPYGFDDDVCDCYLSKNEIQKEGATIRMVFYPCAHKKRMKKIIVRNVNNIEYVEGEYLKLGRETIGCEDISYLKIGDREEINDR